MDDCEVWGWIGYTGWFFLSFGCDLFSEKPMTGSDFRDKAIGFEFGTSVTFFSEFPFPIAFEVSLLSFFRR